MKRLFFFFLIICNLSFCVAQEEQELIIDTSQKEEKQIVSENQLKEYRSQKDFNYIEEEQDISWWQNFKRWLNDIYHSILEFLFGDLENATGLLKWFIANLPYIILGFVILFVIWLFIKLNPAKDKSYKQQAAEVILSEEDKIITQEDIPALINSALSEKNYRLAFRYYYLLSIKSLKNSSIIDYRQEKTNHDYLDELIKTDFHTDFKVLTNWYDYIWYGNFELNQFQYQNLEVRLESLKNKITKKQAS